MTLAGAGPSRDISLMIGCENTNTLPDSYGSYDSTAHTTAQSINAAWSLIPFGTVYYCKQPHLHLQNEIKVCYYKRRMIGMHVVLHHLKRKLGRLLASAIALTLANHIKTCQGL